MSEELLHNEIMRAIGNLEGKIDGINQRLDVSNGRLSKHDEKIQSLEISRGELKGGSKIFMMFVGAVGALIMFVLSVAKDIFLR